METLNIAWKILAILAFISLIIFWRERNSVWGSLTLGVIIGLLIALFKKGDFDWYIVLKVGVISVLVGVFSELMSKIGEHIKKRHNS
jgi:general stress protein CsbA